MARTPRRASGASRRGTPPVARLPCLVSSGKTGVAALLPRDSRHVARPTRRSSGRARQRQRSGRRSADRGPCDRTGPRRAGAQRRRILHVRPDGQLLRHRQLHLPGHGRRRQFARRHGHPHRQLGERRPGVPGRRLRRQRRPRARHQPDSHDVRRRRRVHPRHRPLIQASRQRQFRPRKFKRRRSRPHPAPVRKSAPRLLPSPRWIFLRH